jgi:hypothetical protein
MAAKKVKEDPEVEQAAADTSGPPLAVNNANRADLGGIKAALTGKFCRAVSGEHAGRYGVYLQTSSVTKDGSPDDVIVRTRDEHDELLVVKYADLVHAEAGGR